jgi:hypothetical protein
MEYPCGAASVPEANVGAMAKDYQISKTTGACQACGRALEPGEAYVAAVRDADGELLRQDHCQTCWNASPRDGTESLASWLARVPFPKERKRLFVDDEVLRGFFERLAGCEDEAKVRFRFVLALVLMRKKQLVYEGSSTDPQGREVWSMRVRGGEEVHAVVDPKLDERSIAEVTADLGQILEADL